MDDTLPSTPVHYAGFWRRFNAYGIDASIVAFLAWLIDSFILQNAFAQTPNELQQLNDLVNAMQTGVVSPALMDTVKESLVDSMLGGSVIGPNSYVMIVVSAIYNILFVTGTWHATPGKHWLGMKVVHRDGSPLTLRQSIARHAFSGISMLPLGLGCVTIGVTAEKTAPHDMICHTRVVRTNL